MYGSSGRIIHSFYMYLLGGVLGQVAGKQSEIYAQEENWWAPLWDWREWGPKEEAEVWGSYNRGVNPWALQLGWPSRVVLSFGQGGWALAVLHSCSLEWCSYEKSAASAHGSWEEGSHHSGKESWLEHLAVPHRTHWSCPLRFWPPSRHWRYCVEQEQTCSVLLRSWCLISDSIFFKNDTNKNLWLLDANTYIRLVQK